MKKAFKAAFRLRVWESTGRLVDTNQGHLFIDKPDGFRWIPDNTRHPIIIINARYAWIYDRDMAQASRQSTQTLPKNSPFSLLNRSLQAIQRDFTVVQCIHNKKEGHTFFLKSNDPQSTIQSLQLSFKKQQLIMMRFKNAFNQTIQFDFNSISYHANLPPSLFRFSPPPGVDVIKS